MTNENQQTTTVDPKQPIPFGTRLKSAREALGLERKDAASQLRLSEKIITMMEKDKYPTDLPATFIRGYIRAYGKLLQIPEQEIKKAIEPIKQKQTSYAPLPPLKQFGSAPVTSGNYFMQIFTYLIIFTMLGLVGMWWYTHNGIPTNGLENQVAVIPESLNTSHPPSAVSTETLPPTTTVQAAPQQTQDNKQIAIPAPLAPATTSPTTVAPAPIAPALSPSNHQAAAPITSPITHPANTPKRESYEPKQDDIDDDYDNYNDSENAADY